MSSRLALVSASSKWVRSVGMVPGCHACRTPSRRVISARSWEGLRPLRSSEGWSWAFGLSGAGASGMGSSFELPGPLACGGEADVGFSYVARSAADAPMGGHWHGKICRHCSKPRWQPRHVEDFPIVRRKQTEHMRSTLVCLGSCEPLLASCQRSWSTAGAGGGVG